ncbi:hypothetical protein D1BOALGB6SA_7215 [Olavius sp. associated proteobacterium Delta 1]|nr:hypothetical protein D1BOALGB6SA_7215 [Olavius sp. associated proteobacterium Delta 1]
MKKLNWGVPAAAGLSVVGCSSFCDDWVYLPEVRYDLASYFT